MIGCRKIKRIYIKVVRLTLLLTVPGLHGSYVIYQWTRLSRMFCI